MNRTDNSAITRSPQISLSRLSTGFEFPWSNLVSHSDNAGIFPFNASSVSFHNSSPISSTSTTRPLPSILAIQTVTIMNSKHYSNSSQSCDSSVTSLAPLNISNSLPMQIDTFTTTYSAVMETSMAFNSEGADFPVLVLYWHTWTDIISGHDGRISLARDFSVLSSRCSIATASLQANILHHDHQTRERCNNGCGNLSGFRCDCRNYSHNSDRKHAIS